MKRTIFYLSLIPVFALAVGWAVWTSRVTATDAEATPRLSVQVCWPTAWGARPNAIAWLAAEEFFRPPPGSLITPPSRVTHAQWIFDKPVSVEWNYGTHIQALYGADVPHDTTVVTAMWSSTSGGFRYVGQVSTNVSGIVQIYADLCAFAAPAPAQPAAVHVSAVPAAKPLLLPVGPRRPRNLRVLHRVQHPRMNSGRQFLYFTVTDENGVSVPGTRVDLTVRYPQAVRRYGYGPADHNGQLYIWFDVGKLWGGYNVPIDIVASHQGVVARSQASFWVP